MKLIGFTNKFYTLWEYTSNITTDSRNRRIKVEDYQYIKNISMDSEKAFAQYPGVEFKENLRGKSQSFRENTFIDYIDNDTFRMGKYRGSKIEEVNDVNYTAWYYDACSSNEAHKEVIRQYLRKHGYDFVTVTFESGCTEQMLLTPGEVAYRRKREENVKEMSKKVKNSEVIEFTPDSNIDEDGEYTDTGVTYKFPEFKEMSYQGYPYYVPTQNGKVKRVKNKTVIVTKYDWDAEKKTLTIREFDVKK